MIQVEVIYRFNNNEDRNRYFNLITQLRIVEQSRLEHENYAYEVFIPLGTNNVVKLLEQWENQGSIDFHCAQSYVVELLEKRKPFVCEIEVTHFELKKI